MTAPTPATPPTATTLADALADADAAPADAAPADAHLDTPAEPASSPMLPGPSGTVFPGPWTAASDTDVVVFLIGMRFNGLRGIGHALRAFVAMPRMLASLESDRSKGCLGGHTAFGWRTAYVMQYWRSYDALEAFARAPKDEHMPAWRWYNQLGTKASGVGIWHETFQVAAGAYESIYVNMPNFGLAKATEHLPVTRANRTSRDRIAAPATAPG